MKLRYRRRAITMRIGKPIYLDRYRRAYEAGDERTRKAILDGCSAVVMREIAKLTRQRYHFGERAVARLKSYADEGDSGDGCSP
jgi:hypothetical protein